MEGGYPALGRFSNNLHTSMSMIVGRASPLPFRHERSGLCILLCHKRVRVKTMELGFKRLLECDASPYIEKPWL